MKIVQTTTTMAISMVFLHLNIAAAFAENPEPSPNLGLSVNNGVVYKDGRPYRAIGINYFNAFYRNLIDGSNTSYIQGFDILEQYDIPFIRFSLTGYWPIHFAVYQNDKAEFYRRLDQFVAEAEQRNIGLIPSFFWTQFMFPDILGEPVNRWGDPTSQTRQLMRDFTAEVVQRYKDSPAIWGWEFANEYNLYSDLPNAEERRPPTWTSLGNPATRSAEDDLYGDMIRSAMVEFAAVVRQYDPHRIIGSGNAMNRASQWNQYHHLTWTHDTPAQSSEMYDFFNPDPMDTIGGHPYDLLAWDIPIALAAQKGKAVFFGEFGVLGHDETARQGFAAMLNKIVDLAVPLSAVWNFDRQQADDPWNIHPSNERYWMLEEIRQTNLVLTMIKIDVDIDASADTQIVESQPDKAFGEHHSLAVTNFSPYRARTMLRFDLNDIPHDQIIVSATLRLRLGTWGWSVPLKVTGHKVLVPWDETTTTWNTLGQFPGSGGVAGSDYYADPVFSHTFTAQQGAGGSGMFVEFDVAEMVRDWYEDPSSNFGIYLTDALLDSGDNSDSIKYFLGRNSWMGSDTTPRLSVTYGYIP